MFNRNFLDLPEQEEPEPKVPAIIQQSLARPSDATADRPHELRYTHFGVKFSTAFRLPVLTAVNIDGKNSVRIKRTGDRWFFDDRIEKRFQHGHVAFKDAEIDRGHMVRREDPNWGENASQADSDTFHYTNAAPQHSRLNQGKQLWQGLENYILDNSRTHGFKACVFTAPVFADDDPVLEEEKARMPLGRNSFGKLYWMPKPRTGPVLLQLRLPRSHHSAVDDRLKVVDVRDIRAGRSIQSSTTPGKFRGPAFAVISMTFGDAILGSFIAFPPPEITPARHFAASFSDA